MDVLCRLGNDKDRTPDAAEVPVVSTAFGEVYLRIAALLRYFHLQTVLLFTEEHTVADIDGMARKAALIQTVASLTSVNLHVGIGEHGLKHQQYLSSRPILRQRKLRLVLTRLVSNALWCGFAIETHAILVGAKALQLPARWYANLRPLAAVAPVGTIEVPLYHVVTAVTTQILTLCFH